MNQCTVIDTPIQVKQTYVQHLFDPHVIKKKQPGYEVDVFYICFTVGVRVRNTNPF